MNTDFDLENINMEKNHNYEGGALYVAGNYKDKKTGKYLKKSIKNSIFK